MQCNHTSSIERLVFEKRCILSEAFEEVEALLRQHDSSRPRPLEWREWVDVWGLSHSAILMEMPMVASGSEIKIRSGTVLTLSYFVHITIHTTFSADSNSSNGPETELHFHWSKGDCRTSSWESFKPLETERISHGVPAIRLSSSCEANVWRNN